MENNVQWDKIAQERFEHRMSGGDVSYDTILLPTIKSYLSLCQVNNVLDFGCGTGELSFEIAKMGFNVTGVDISKRSIEIAQKNFNCENLRFIDRPLSDINFESKFYLAVANMSLMDTRDLTSNLMEINNRLVNNGRFISIITHPAFWPIYWDYVNEGNFKYLRECEISKSYKTKTKLFDYTTTHYHRPVSYYLNKFIETNFRISDVKELRNPYDSEWFPRFMFFEIEKNSV